MKSKETKLIKDLYSHYQPETDVNDEFINSLYDQYGSIRGVLMNLILKFEPNADVSDEYLDNKLDQYGLLDKTDEVKPVDEPQQEKPSTQEENKVKAKENTAEAPKEKEANQPEKPKSKSNLIIIAAVLIVLVALGIIGGNLYRQNSLLQSSLQNSIQQNEELIKEQEAQAEEEILYSEEVSGSELDPEVEAQWDDDQTSYAKSLASNLNIRSTPEITDNVIGVLQLDDLVEILDTVQGDNSSVINGMLNRETILNINGTDLTFKKGKVFRVIGEESYDSYKVIIDNRNTEAFVQKSRLDIQDQEVWVNILFKDPETGNYLKGFVYQKFLSKQGGIIADNRYFEVYNTYQDQNEPYLILRSDPYSKSTKLDEMRDGTKLELLSKNHGNSKKWFKVKMIESGLIGYAHSKWLRPVYNSNDDFYIIAVDIASSESEAIDKVDALVEEGYNVANFLWIPDYPSLSGANYYSVYIGPFYDIDDLIFEIEDYRLVNPKAYGLLVSTKSNTRVEIRGANNIKRFD